MKNKFQAEQLDLKNAFMQSPIATYILKGPNHIIELANEKALELSNRTYDEVINKSILKAFPELVEQGFQEILDHVFVTGEQYVSNEDSLSLVRNGKKETVYINFVYKPIFNENKEITGIIGIGVDNSLQREARRKSEENLKSALHRLEESNKRFRNTVKQAPVGICILKGKDFIVEVANEAYLKLVDKKEADFIDRPLFEVLPEVEYVVAPLLESVLKTGVPYYGNEFMIDIQRHGQKETTYFNFVYQPLCEGNETTSGIIVVASEVTAIVESKQKVIESERQFREFITQSPIAMTIFRGPDFIIENPNTALLEGIWQRKLEEVENKKLLDAFPELKDQAFPKLLATVFKTGIAYSEKESLAFIGKDNLKRKYYLDFQYAPLFEKNGDVTGIMATVSDVTDKVEARLKIEESEQRLLLANEAAEMGTFDWDIANEVFFQSERVARIFGYDHNKQVNYKDLLNAIHPDDKIIRDMATQESLLNGSLIYEARIVWQDKSIHWIRLFGKVIYNDNQEPQKMYGTVMDITSQKQSQLALEESENKLNIAIEATDLGIFDIHLQQEEINYSPKYLEIYGFGPTDKPSRKDIIDRIHPDDIAGRTAAMKLATKTGTLNHETRVIYKDNSIHWIRVRGKIVYDKDNQPERVLGTVRDITKDKDATRQLEENEERLQIAIESAELGTWELNLKTRESYLSPKYLEILGFSKDENPSYQELLSKVHPDDLDNRNKKMADAIKTGKLDYEIRLSPIANNIKWISAKGKIFYDKNGEAEKALGTIRDITDRKIIEQDLEKKVIERTAELQKSEEINFRMINEIEDYAIILLNKNGIIENWNKGAEKIKGYSSAEILGKHFSIFYTEEDQQKDVPSTLLQQAIISGRSSEENWRVKKDGTVFWANIVITALHNEQNEVIGFSKITRDLTQKRIVEQELQEKSAELEKANLSLEKSNSELEQFAYVASHDLQEPLRKIQFFIERIQKAFPKDDDSATVYFDKVKNSTIRMNTLIKDLLDFSRLSQTNDRFTTVDLNIILGNIKNDFELLIQQKQATVKVLELPTIEAVPLQMQQLFYNLISNALKFSKKDEPSLITISSNKLHAIEVESSYPGLDRRLSYYCITVQDNGIGFDQQYADKVFIIFQRLNDMYSYSGTGIGLALCKKIALNHNGDIFAKSEEGKGSSFYIILPEKQL